MATSPRRRRAAPRLIRVLIPPSPDGPGLLRIAVGKQATVYQFRQVENHLGGTAFELRKLQPADVYHVRIGKPRDCCCECLGFLSHSKCKHLLGLLALQKAGLIASQHRSVGAFAAADPEGYEQHMESIAEAFDGQASSAVSDDEQPWPGEEQPVDPAA